MQRWEIRFGNGIYHDKKCILQEFSKIRSLESISKLATDQTQSILVMPSGSGQSGDLVILLGCS